MKIVSERQLRLQLWSVRQLMASNSSGCIEKLGELGIAEVEGYDLILLKQLMPTLNGLGINVNSSFIYWMHIFDDATMVNQFNHSWLPEYWGIEHEIELALELNLDTLVLGYIPPQFRYHLDDIKRIAEKINEANEKCLSAGITFLYHNHAFEFKTLDGVIPFFYLLKNTDVKFEFDVFWSQVANYNPMEVVEILGDRLRQIHLKSGVVGTAAEYNESDFGPERFCCLGEGDVDVVSVLNFCEKKSIKYFIEQDASNNIFQDIKCSCDFLKSRWGCDY